MQVVTRALSMDLAVRAPKKAGDTSGSASGSRSVYVGFDLRDLTPAIQSFVYLLEREDLKVSRARGGPHYRISRVADGEHSYPGQLVATPHYRLDVMDQK